MSPLVCVRASRCQTAARLQNELRVIWESGRAIVSETEGKYSVELFKEGGEGAGQEEIIDRHDNLTVAPGDLSRPCFTISGPAGHAVRPRPRSGEE